MFQESLIESTALLQTGSRWPAVVSITAQTAVAVALVSLPLLHPEILPLKAPGMTLTPPPFHAPQPPPPQPQRIRIEAATSNALPAAAAAPMTVAPVLSSHLRPAGEVPDGPPGPVALVMGDGATGSPLAAVGGNNVGPRIVVAGPMSQGPPTRVSSGVSAGLLLAPIRPDYPVIAKISRVQGTVIVQAIISRKGQIESAHVLSGPPLLQNAALEAIRNAHYRPYLLNNEPTEVETVISVNFRL